MSILHPFSNKTTLLPVFDTFARCGLNTPSHASSQQQRASFHWRWANLRPALSSQSVLGFHTAPGKAVSVDHPVG